MGTPTRSTLPSIALWLGLRSRTRPLPVLICRALMEDSPSASRRASLLLVQLAALASMLPAVRLAHYCRECDRLLSLVQAQSTQDAASCHVLLHAALRLAASTQFPSPQAAMHLFDGASLDELRRARGLRALSENNATPCRLVQNSPHLREIIAKRLVGTQCLLDMHDGITVQGRLEHDSSILQRVGAMEAGAVLLDGIDANACLSQGSLQRLRLEIYCRLKSAPQAAPGSIVAMRFSFVELAQEALLHSVCTRLAALLQVEVSSTNQSLQPCLHLLHQTAACLKFMPTETAKAVRGLVLHGQTLAAHLCCWLVQDKEGYTLLCLCLLALERQLLALGGFLPEERLKVRVTSRLARRVQHFIRRHRHHLRDEYRLRDLCLREIACVELKSIHVRLVHTLQRHRHPGLFAHEDELFHSIVSLKSIALYLGEVTLYEIYWGIRELASLAIERQLALSKSVLRVLLRASAYGLRSSQENQSESDQNRRVLRKLIEALHAQRENFFLSLISPERRVSLRADEDRARPILRLATGQLPTFLAQNIHVLIREPQQIYACQNVQEFVHLSRRHLLELNFLATGARALQVYRVAALCEVMAELYRALHSVTLLPPSSVLRRHLRAAHCCLRKALNQAAARQSVQDVRPIILMLYHFLESLDEPLVAEESSSNKEQRALIAVNALTADLRAFTDVFDSLSGKGNSSRFRLAYAQLRELHSATRQLQEDLAGRGQVHIGRLRGPLLRLVGRLGNEGDKQVRLFFVDEDAHAPRELVQCLQRALENLLTQLLERSIEPTAQRKAQGKMDTASIHIRATRSEQALNIWVEDDGAGLPETALASVQEVFSVTRGDVSLEPKRGAGCRVRIRLPLISARWDIATKPL